MAAKRRPGEVWVNGIKYSIAWVDELTYQGRSSYGYSDHQAARIDINAGCDEQVQRITLVHECMHAAWTLGGGRVVDIPKGMRKGHDAEELAISMLEMGVASLFIDSRNEQVREWLSA